MPGWMLSFWRIWGAFTLAGKYAPAASATSAPSNPSPTTPALRRGTIWAPSGWVLARELSMDEIREIRRRTSPGAGAGNLLPRGPCACPTRPLPALQLHDRSGLQPGRLRPALPLPVRPDGGEAPRRKYFPVFEDEKGTYIMNSRDMCMIDHLDDLMDAGVGLPEDRGPGQIRLLCRHRYRCYRHVIDDVAQGRARRPRLAGRGGARQPPPLFHRFFYGPPGQYYENSRYIRTGRSAPW